MKLLLTQTDAAKLLGIKRQTVGRMFADGTLPTVIVTRRKYTTAKAIYRMIDEMIGPEVGPTETTDSSQTITNRPTSRRAKTADSGKKHEWRHGFRAKR